MRAPVSWLVEYVEGAPVATGREVAAALVRMGLEEEGLHGGDISGPLVVGRVLEFVEEPQKNGRTIRCARSTWASTVSRVTEGTPQGVVCGALNFDVGDLVVVVLPGAVLPGDKVIAARKTYGHVSNGMICSAEELGLGSGPDASASIVVLQSLLGEEAAAKLTPGDDAIELLGLADEVVEVTVTPDRGYCLSMRGIAREYAHATGGTLRDPAAIAAAAAKQQRVCRAAGRRGPAERPRGLRPLRGPGGEGGQRFGDLAAVDAEATQPDGHATHLTGGRCHQLRDARTGPAIARLRRVSPAGADRGAPCAGRRDVEDPR
jgi:phenylalanyl-tRNA synthetase beta chain